MAVARAPAPEGEAVPVNAIFTYCEKVPAGTCIVTFQVGPEYPSVTGISGETVSPMVRISMETDEKSLVVAME
jgi:hypothetical protein